MPTIHLSVSVTGRRLVSWVLIAWAGPSLCQTEAFAGGPACPDPNALYAQCPSFAANGAEERYFAYSDLAADVSVADNFTLQGEWIIRRIRWWGTRLLVGSDAGCFTPGIDDFTVLLWRDTGGSPGGPDPVPIPSYTVTSSAGAVGDIPAGLGPVPVREYELAFEDAAFHPDPGQTYWLEVHNHRDVCSWVWVTAPNPPGDGTSRKRSPSTDPDWSTPTARGFDLAFALVGDPLTIPAASDWGLAALALVLLTAGAIVLRRQHALYSPG
ncbi:MAG: hypothetical protein ACYTFA_08415 [Planctomycetota bacterium]|jgi:hypothetical protein